MEIPESKPKDIEVKAEPVGKNAGQAASTDAAAAIRWEVKRNSLGDISITSSIDRKKWPTAADVCRALPAKYRKELTDHVRRIGYSLEGLINYYWGTISPEDWARAYCTAYIKQSSMPDVGECATRGPLSHAYIALDDTLYRLNPVALVGTNKALATMRKASKAKIDAQIKERLEEAQSQANKIISNANVNSHSILAAAQKKMDEANKKLADAVSIPPDWLSASGYPIMRYGSPSDWRVVMAIDMTITEFVYNCRDPKDANSFLSRTWKAKTARPLTFYCVAQIGKAFSVSSIFTLFHFNHPHITRSQSCMQPADAPPTLNSTADINHLVSAIKRTLTKIDLNSMLVNPSSWHPEIWRFVPDDLAKLLNDPEDFSNALYKATVEAAPKKNAPVKPEEVPATQRVSHDEEFKSTWTL